MGRVLEKVGEVNTTEDLRNHAHSASSSIFDVLSHFNQQHLHVKVSFEDFDR